MHQESYEQFRSFSTDVAHEIYSSKGAGSVSTFDPITILAIMEIAVLVFKGLAWLWAKLRKKSIAEFLTNPSPHLRKKIYGDIDLVYNHYMQDKPGQFDFSKEELYQAFVTRGSKLTQQESVAMMEGV